MTTYIMFVLDETGSMYGKKQDTIGSYNSYIGKLKKELDNTVFSLMIFNASKLEWIHDGVSLNVAKELDEDSYNPTEATPLWDAFGVALRKMEELTKHAGPDDKVVVTVLTDGLENASQEYSPEDVRKMVEEHDDWAITFLGANMDSWSDVGNNLGLFAGAVMDYDTDNIGEAINTHTASTLNYARGTVSASNFYEEEEEK